MGQERASEKGRSATKRARLGEKGQDPAHSQPVAGPPCSESGRTGRGAERAPASRSLPGQRRGVGTGYRTQALLHLSPPCASDAPSQSMRQWSVHTPQRCVPFSELFPGQITAGYIHEVHHATAGLQAEALGAQVFVCKRNRFQHPSPVGFPGLPQPWDQGGMIPVPWCVQSSSVSA